MSQAIRGLLLALLFAASLGCAQKDDGGDALRAELHELEEQLEKARTLERKLPALEAEVDALDYQVAQLEQVLVVSEPDGLVRLRRALMSSGFRDPELSSLGLMQLEAVPVLRIRVEATTPYEQAFLAIEELTRRPLLVVPEELSIKREDDGGTARVVFVARLGLSPDYR